MQWNAIKNYFDCLNSAAQANFLDLYRVGAVYIVAWDLAYHELAINVPQ